MEGRTVVTREGLGAHQELKGMGGNNKPYGGRMEIRVNGTLTKELCICLLLRTIKLKSFGKIKVGAAEKHSVLVLHRHTKLGSINEREGPQDGRMRGVSHGGAPGTVSSDMFYLCRSNV